MPRPLRFQPEEWTTHFVTSRCIQSRMLLRPSRAGNRLIVGVFARALERYDVRIFGLCVLSNHYHLLIATPDASTCLCGELRHSWGLVAQDPAAGPPSLRSSKLKIPS